MVSTVSRLFRWSQVSVIERSCYEGCYEVRLRCGLLCIGPIAILRRIRAVNIAALNGYAFRSLADITLEALKTVVRSYHCGLKEASPDKLPHPLAPAFAGLPTAEDICPPKGAALGLLPRDMPPTKLSVELDGSLMNTPLNETKSPITWLV